MLRRILLFHPSTPTQEELDDYKMAIANHHYQLPFLRYLSCSLRKLTEAFRFHCFNI